MANFIDITGRSFGLWTVLRRVENVGAQPYWLCRCACGTEKACAGGDLRGGKTLSCGCYRAASQSERATVHGYTRHPLYQRWRAMLTRCEDPDHASFERYGARGISVCERWRSFDVFLEDMGASFKPGMSIERRDNSGNYEPGNCEWATAKQQALNRSSNVRVETSRGLLTLSEIADIAGLSTRVIHGRFCRGWTGDRLLLGKQKPGAKLGSKRGKPTSG